MDLLSLGIVPVFLISVLIGKLRPYRSVDRWLIPVVIVLIFTISAWGGYSISLSQLGQTVALAILYSLAGVSLSYLLGMLIPGSRVGRKGSGSMGMQWKFATAIMVGWFIGEVSRPLSLPYDFMIDLELYFLMVLAGISTGPSFSLRNIMKGGRVGLLASVVGVLSSVVVGILFNLFISVPLGTSLGISLGMGWYTYDGPAVASITGSSFYGVVGFLANFFREQITYMVIPLLRGKPESLISIGGATTMDDTLAVYVRSLGPDFAVPSVINGMLLTVLVPVIVPFVLLIRY